MSFVKHHGLDHMRVFSVLSLELFCCFDADVEIRVHGGLCLIARASCEREKGREDREDREEEDRLTGLSISKTPQM